MQWETDKIELRRSSGECICTKIEVWARSAYFRWVCLANWRRQPQFLLFKVQWVLVRHFAMTLVHSSIQISGYCQIRSVWIWVKFSENKVRKFVVRVDLIKLFVVTQTFNNSLWAKWLSSNIKVLRQLHESFFQRFETQNKPRYCKYDAWSSSVITII